MLKKYKSCLSCSQKHIKCEGGNPCPNCKKKGIKCQYIQKIIQTEVILKQPNITDLQLNYYFEKFVGKHLSQVPINGNIRRFDIITSMINLKHHQSEKIPIQKLMFKYCAVAVEYVKKNFFFKFFKGHNEKVI